MPKKQKTKKPRKKKCRVCGLSFQPYNSLQICCSPKCAIEYAKQQQEKKAKREHKQAKEALKTHPQLTQEVQTVFNAYIRERDKDLPCISCGTTNPAEHLTGGSWDCGHYITVGSAPELRFTEINAHKQCKECNNYKGGNYANYRKGLIQRIGQEKVDWLEGPHEPLNNSKEDLRELRAYYRRKLKELK